MKNREIIKKWTPDKVILMIINFILIFYYYFFFFIISREVDLNFGLEFNGPVNTTKVMSNL